ncbi:hypothetical protein DPMN_119815 [Dreissena polymorpha]|uniref:C2H2-type domain-containing protein n=1 Tax=Dreissena polymorpha TaxID=45954 RepID=A0A9D4GMN8_DREPO|nr:hypothetical protein DPMN_119815 [Dreissena polymorpha]
MEAEAAHYTLSRRQRDAFAFSETSSRRQLIPTYQSSLANIDFRMRSCQTCGKQFSNAGELTKHVALNHTGSKPISCNVCGKRFGSSRQMKSHYQQHREPRLEEFGYLRTPRQARDLVSETTSSSETTVGSFHRIPKGLKTYVSENSPTAKDTFGTEQSFHPYVPNTHKLKLLRDMYEDPDHPRLQTVDTKLPDIRSTMEKLSLPTEKKAKKNEIHSRC